ncbi:MAG: hypothetical protein AAFV96_13720 [Pseudomonadota bacterium]
MDEAANRIRSEVDQDANIIVGSTLDPEMVGKMRVSVVATGIDAAEAAEAPMPRRRATVEAEASIEAPVQEAPATPAPAAAPTLAPAAMREEPPMTPSFIDTQPTSEPPAEPAIARAPEPRVEPAAPTQVPAPAAAQTPAPQQMPERSREPVVTRRPGEPTAETLQRLQAAVSAVPEPSGRVATPPAHRPEAPAKPAPTEEGRFAINNLIHRMTGARDERPAEPAAPRPQEVERDPNDIPAFLRRQAN